jgi:hypothetical protein
MPPPLTLPHSRHAHTGQPDAQYVFPLTLVAQCLGLPLGPMFQRSIGERSTLLLGGFLMATGVLLAS